LREKISKFKQRLKWLDPFTYVDLALEKYWPARQGKRTEAQEIGYNLIYLVSAFVFAFLIYQAFSVGLQTKSPIVIVVSESMEPNLYRGDVVFIQGVSAQNLKAQEINYPGKLSKKIFSEFGDVNYQTSAVSKSGFEISQIQVSNSKIAPNTEGDIALYYSSFTGEQIIHRAILKIKASDGTFLLTKGDNEITNWSFDQDCGKVFQKQIAGTDLTQTALEKPCITLYPLKVSEIDGREAFRIPLIGCVKVWAFDDLPSLLFKGRMPDNYRGGLC